MSQLLAIRERLRNIGNLRKVTTAIELVTKTRILKVRQNAANARAYHHAFADLYATVAGAAERKRDPDHSRSQAQGGGRLILIGFLSQKGFCGAFNDRLLTHLRSEMEAAPKPPELVLIGRRSAKWTLHIRTSFRHLEGRERTYREEFAPLLDELAGAILKGERIELSLAYNAFHSVLVQEPVVRIAYPLSGQGDGEAGEGPDPIFEPGLEELSRAMLRSYLEACVDRAYWESAIGEHSARLLAMKNANDNASQILESLQLEYNKTRQRKITQELSEIVSAFDVLRTVQIHQQQETD